MMVRLITFYRKWLNKGHQRCHQLCMLLQAHRLEAKRAQNQHLMTSKRSKNLMLLSTVHRSKNRWHSKCKNMVDRCKYCGMGHPPRQCPAYGKRYGGCGKQNHFKAGCKSTCQQKQDQLDRKTVHKVIQEVKSCIVGSEEQERSFDVVRVK